VTRKEYQFYVEADRLIAGRPVRSIKRRIKLFFTPDYIESFMLILRKVEYLRGKKGFFQKIAGIFAKNKFNRISLKLGFSIAPNVFGPGLYIPHYGTIVVNGNAKVGANCVLHTSTCIAGSEQKKLGDNLYISTGVIISGNTNIGDNVTISANSLVNKSVAESNVLLGGTPAKVIKERAAWHQCDDHEEFKAAVEQIEKLRKKMLG
jgi:serine O-acetyltransferase